MSRILLLGGIGRLGARRKTVSILLLCLSIAIVFSWTSAVLCSTLTIADDGGPAPATPYDPLIVTVDSINYIASQTPATRNYPNNNPVITYQYYDNIAGQYAGSRYVWMTTNFSYETAPIPVAKPISDTFALPSSGWWELKGLYKLQYEVTFVASSGGTTSPATGAYWYDSGSSVPISATPDVSYMFVQWTVTGGVSVADQFDPTTTMTVAGSGTVEAVFTQAFQPIDFYLVGVGTDATGTVFTLGGTPYTKGQFDFQLNLLEGSAYAFSWSSPISGAAQTRYVWTSTSGLSTAQSGSITIPASPGSLTGNYDTQYYTTITAGTGGTINASSSWYDASSTAVMTATPSTGYAFKDWTTSGSVSVSDPNSPTTTMTVGGVGSVQANFEPILVDITFIQSGIGMDFSGAVLNVDGAAVLRGELAKAYSWMLGSSHTFSWFSPLSVSADKRYLWTSSSGLSTLQSGTIVVPSSPGSVTGTYKAQYYATIAAGAGGTVNASSGWFDSSSTVTMTATPNTGYAFVNWVTTGSLSVADPNSPTTILTVGGAGSVSAVFQLLPVQVAIMQSGIGTDFSGAVVTIDGANVQRSELTKTYSWSVGSSHTFSWLSPLSVSSDKRYLWSWTSGLSAAQSGTVVVPSGGGNIDGHYKVQYYVAITAGGGGSVSRASDWYDSSTPISITATPNTGYAFKNWVATGGVSVANPNSAVTTMTVTGAGTLQGTFELLPVGVSFSQSGIGIDFLGAVLNVDGAPVLCPELMKTYSWVVGSTHSFSWLSPLVASADKRYVWSATTGLSTAQGGDITVPSGAGFVDGQYETEYYITIASGAGGSVNATSGWMDAFSSFIMTASPSTGYGFKNWTVTGGAAVSDPYSATATVTVTGAGAVQATFELLPVGVSFSQSGIGTDFSGVVVTVDGSGVQLSELTKTYSWVVGSDHSFSWLSVLTVSAEKRYVWASTSGLSTLQSGAVTTPSSSGVVAGAYSAEYYVAVEASTGGTASPGAGNWYGDGEMVSISANPFANFVFSGWTVTGGVVVADPAARSTTLTVSGSGTVRANFAYVAPAVDVTIQPSEGGSTTPSGTMSFQQGETVNITATPAPGYRFVGWGVSGGATVESPTSPSTTMTVNGPATVTATFNLLEGPSFAVTFQSSEGGSVSPSGEKSYQEGALVEISASPDNRHSFSGWVVDGNVTVADPASATTTLTVYGPATVTALFSEMVNVTFQSSAGGSTIPSGNGSYVLGTTLEIVAIPAEGWIFLGWNVTGGDASVADPASATTTITINDHAVVIARFRQADSIPPSVTDLYPANGSTIDGGSFAIHASFSDDTAIDTSSVVLKVDGVEVSGVEVTPGGISYAGALPPGAHTVELTVKDTDGNPRTVTWNVLASAEAPPLSIETLAIVGVEILTVVTIAVVWWMRRGPWAPAPQPKKPAVH